MRRKYEHCVDKLLSVSFLTPARGKVSTKAVPLDNLGIAAEPVRFLEYLIEGAEPAAVPYGAGLLVRVPDAARFALHKLAVSQRRPQWQSGKARKDVDQAEALIHFLADTRPGNLRAAWNACAGMPAKFRTQLRAAVRLLPKEARAAMAGLT